MNVIGIIFLIIFIFSAHFVHAQHGDVILWEEGKKLTWSDFTEIPSNPEYAAASSIFLHYSVCKRSIWNSKVVLKVECTFQKRNSYVSKHGKHPFVLRHEQLHFDIGELFARKLRMEFAHSKNNVDNVEAQAESIYHII